MWTGTIKDELQIAASLRSSQRRTLVIASLFCVAICLWIVIIGDLRSDPVRGVDAGTIEDELQIAA